MMLQNKEWRVHASMVNYWKAQKLVRFIYSYVLSVTQQYKHILKSPLQSIHAAIMEYMKDSLVKRTPIS